MTKGERIKKRRLELDLTLDQVSKIVDVSRQTIQRYESGVIQTIPSDKIELLASALNTTPLYIMGWEKGLPPKEEDDIISEYNLDEYELAEYNRIMDMNLLMFNNKKISENDKEKLEKTLKEIFIKSLLRKREEENK